jgi:hypothetical protein
MINAILKLIKKPNIIAFYKHLYIISLRLFILFISENIKKKRLTL